MARNRRQQQQRDERPAKIEEILRLMSEDGVGLRRACKAVGIAKPTFLGWVAQDKTEGGDLDERYARARKMMWEIQAERALDIADNCEPTSEHVQKARLQVDTRKWMLSKQLPAKYGDSLKVKGDADNPLQMGIQVRFVKPEQEQDDGE